MLVVNISGLANLLLKTGLGCFVCDRAVCVGGKHIHKASMALAMGSALTGCYQLSHPDFEINTWQVFVVY